LEISSTGPSDSEFKIEWFDQHLRGLENLLGIANRLSNAAAGPEKSYLAYQASLVFCKLALGVLGTLRFIPGSIYYADKVANAIDLSSASVLARQVLSDTVTFLYLADRNITDEDRAFRGFVWTLQALKQSRDYIALHDPNDPLLKQLEPELAKRFDDFDKHPLSKGISDSIMGQIKGGRRALWKSDYDIFKGYGIRKKVYDLPSLIFSNFVHASELSVNLMLQTSAQGKDNQQRFFFGLVNTIPFFAIDIEVLIQCFPACRSHITDDGLEFLKVCSEPVRKPAASSPSAD
jgi:hypothetical protein